MTTKIAYKICEKSFSDKVSKKAYLKATKWLAINVFAHDELAEKISVMIVKKESKDPTFLVTLFVSLDEGKLKEDFCSQCRRVYNSFYQSEKLHCDECKMSAYRKKNEKYADGLVSIYTKIFEEKGNEEDTNASII